MLKLSGDDLAAAVAGLSTFGNFAWILYQIGNYATAVTGAAMAIAIGQSLQAPPLVLFSLAAVGQATNAMGGSGGPLAVFFCATIACEIGKLVSKETKIEYPGNSSCYGNHWLRDRHGRCSAFQDYL